MNKILILWFVLMSVLFASAQAPVTIGRNANISFFAGYLLQQQNLNCDVNYRGVYLDYPLFKGDNFNLGLFAIYDASNFGDNMARYKSLTSEMAGGFNTGYYFTSSSNSIKSYYIGLAVGYKNSDETGIVSKKNYYSEGKQSDQMIIGNLNLNRYRDARWLTRSQLIGSTQYAINSSKTVSENHLVAKPAATWNKGYWELIFKQSIVGIPLNLSGDRLLEPKLGFGYHYYYAGYPEAISLIGELSLKKLFADDYLSLTFQYKHYPGKETDYFCYGITLNILRLIEKRTDNN